MGNGRLCKCTHTGPLSRQWVGNVWNDGGAVSVSAFLLHDAGHQVTVLVEDVGARVAVDTDTVRRSRHVGGRHCDTVTVTQTLVDARWQRDAEVPHQQHLKQQQNTPLGTASEPTIYCLSCHLVVKDRTRSNKSPRWIPPERHGDIRLLVGWKINVPFQHKNSLYWGQSLGWFSSARLRTANDTVTS